MKKSIYLLVLSLALMSLSLGCGLFSPQSSKATIEISGTDYNPGTTACTLDANLDGGNNVSLSNGGLYQFPLVSPGTHTVNFTFANNVCGSSGTCTMNKYSDTFQTSGGDLYVVQLSQGGACNQVIVSGP